MKKNAAIIGGLLLLLSISCTNQNNDQRIESIDKFLRGQADFYKFNGNVLVAEKGKIFYQRSFGLANYDDHLPLNDSTVFELASIGKQFTAIGILLLEKEGKLDLNDSLRKFFPDLPYHNITIHQMLTHTSGLPDYFDFMYKNWDLRKLAYNNDVIKVMVKEKPVIHFEPGTKWEYSNTGFVLLASIIEKVTGSTFDDFINKNILKPLLMKQSLPSSPRLKDKRPENYAFGHIWSDSLNQFILPDSLPEYDWTHYPYGIRGDGSINSTTGDLLKWSRFLFENNLGLDTLVRKLTHPHILCDTVKLASFERYNGTSKIHYGYGVFIGENEFGDFVWHGGQWPGYLTEIFHYKNEDITIIVLSNNESAAVPIRSALSKIMVGLTIIYPENHQEITLDTLTLDNFTGTYLLNNQKYEITREKDKLFLKYPFSETKKLLSTESDSILFWPGFDFQFEIIKEDNSQERYYQILFGTRLEMQKIK